MSRRTWKLRRRGQALVPVIFIMLILTTLAVGFAVSASREVHAGKSFSTQAQRFYAARGAAYFAASALAKTSSNGATYGVVNGSEFDANGWMQIGDSWVKFDVTDTAGMINLNSADAATLQKLPVFKDNAELVAAITDWKTKGDQASQNGAKSDYYQALTPSYDCKSAPFDSVEELLLVKGMSPSILFGNAAGAPVASNFEGSDSGGKSSGAGISRASSANTRQAGGASGTSGGGTQGGGASAGGGTNGGGNSGGGGQNSAATPAVGDSDWTDIYSDSKLPLSELFTTTVRERNLAADGSPRININTATAEQLQKGLGIPAQLANMLVEFRTSDPNAGGANGGGGGGGGNRPGGGGNRPGGGGNRPGGGGGNRPGGGGNRPGGGGNRPGGGGGNRPGGGGNRPGGGGGNRPGGGFGGGGATSFGSSSENGGGAPLNRATSGENANDTRQSGGLGIQKGRPSGGYGLQTGGGNFGIQKGGQGGGSNAQSGTGGAGNSGASGGGTGQSGAGGASGASRPIFKTIADLMYIPGRTTFDRETMQKVADRVTVDDVPYHDNLVNINTAPAEVLATVPGMDHESLKAILSYREGGKAFQTLGDLFSIASITRQQFLNFAARLCTKSSLYRVRIQVRSQGSPSVYAAVAMIEMTDNGPRIRQWREVSRSPGWDKWAASAALPAPSPPSAP